jgi:hypothetical protein
MVNSACLPSTTLVGISTLPRKAPAWAPKPDPNIITLLPGSAWAGMMLSIAGAATAAAGAGAAGLFTR